MTVQELLTRARSAVGLGCEYRLGGGNDDPGAETPLDDRGTCDCSAFVCWCLGVRRSQPALAWLKRVNGGWWNTDGMWWDACIESTGFTERLDDDEVRPGALVVYPAQWVARAAYDQHPDLKTLVFHGKFPHGPAVGHVGIVSSVGRRGVRVLHCSAGNDRKVQDAIIATDGAPWKAVVYSVFAWPAALVR